MSMTTEVQVATDDQVSLWYCEQCSKSGALLIPPHIDVYTVINALTDAHQTKSPECKALIGTLRIARPNSWYSDTLEAKKKKKART